ncbi:hypothetical protein CBM2585_B50175 [Cupriavidus taiwanensis]|nr:hypothetical protein CBM2585_B50175 [Cupriavidus taiwanensis]
MISRRIGKATSDSSPRGPRLEATSILLQPSHRAPEVALLNIAPDRGRTYMTQARDLSTAAPLSQQFLYILPREVAPAIDEQVDASVAPRPAPALMLVRLASGVGRHRRRACLTETSKGYHDDYGRNRCYPASDPGQYTSAESRRGERLGQCQAGHVSAAVFSQEGAELFVTKLPVGMPEAGDSHRFV